MTRKEICERIYFASKINGIIKDETEQETFIKKLMNKKDSQKAKLITELEALEDGMPAVNFLKAFSVSARAYVASYHELKNVPSNERETPYYAKYTQAAHDMGVIMNVGGRVTRKNNILGSVFGGYYTRIENAMLMTHEPESLRILNSIEIEMRILKNVSAKFAIEETETAETPVTSIRNIKEETKMTKRQLARAGEKTKSQLASEIYQMLITLKKPIDSSSELIFLSRVLSHNRKAELQYWHDDLSAEIAETPVITIEDIKEETKMQNPSIEALKATVTQTFNTCRKTLKNVTSTQSEYIKYRKAPELLEAYLEAAEIFNTANKAFIDALTALEDAGGDFRLSEVGDTPESPRRTNPFTGMPEVTRKVVAI